MVHLALSLAFLAGSTSASLPPSGLLARNNGGSTLNASVIPAAAQVVDQRSFNVLERVEPAVVKNATTPFILPGTTNEAMKAKPFHIYDKQFLKVLGEDPTFKLISENNALLAHEAAVWIPATDDVFFAQNAGGKGSGTGLNQSNVISVINLKDVANLAEGELLNATTVPITPGLEMTNGGTNWKGQIVFANQGRGADIPPSLAVVNPYSPYNSPILLNNYFGRQFNSLNDIRVHPKNKDIYFTDTTYGYSQDFRPLPGMPQQVYRFNTCTGAVTVVADGFTKSNGIVFSPNGDKAYIADTGAGDAFRGFDFQNPSTIYSFDVDDDGTWSNRKTFAFVDAGLPDGLHCDTNGNLFAGVGDGISVWSPSAKLLGKIYHGAGTANFAFAGNRLFVMAENRIYFATMAAEGASYEYDYPSCEEQEHRDDN